MHCFCCSERYDTFFSENTVTITDNGNVVRMITMNFAGTMAPCKICPLGGVWEEQQPIFFILGPLHISETNGARKLKFGTLVGIYRCYGSM